MHVFCNSVVVINCITMHNTMSEVYLNYEWGMPYSFLKKINLCKPDEIKFMRFCC